MTATSKIVTKKILEELIKSLNNIRGWGSVEIFIQNHRITQVIEKNVIKPEQNS